HRLQFQANYTFSKGTNDGTQWRSAQTLNSPTASLIGDHRNADKALSIYNQSNVFRFNMNYHFPGESLKGIVNWVLGGWESNSILTATAGMPLTIGVPFNQSLNGDNQNPDRPNLVPGRSPNPVIGSVDRWYDPTAFSLPARGFYGNLGRATVI